MAIAGIGRFLKLMHYTVTVEPYLGTDGFGKPQYGDPITYKAFIEGAVKRVTTAQGEEKVSSKRVVVGAAVSINPFSRITLPEGHEPRQPKILQASDYSGPQGFHHAELLL